MNTTTVYEQQKEFNHGKMKHPQTGQYTPENTDLHKLLTLQRSRSNRQDGDIQFLLGELADLKQRVKTLEQWGNEI